MSPQEGQDHAGSCHGMIAAGFGQDQIKIMLESEGRCAPPKKLSTSIPVVNAKGMLCQHASLYLCLCAQEHAQEQPHNHAGMQERTQATYLR